MRRIMVWCVAGLPFEPRSRRAIDETLADWAHEVREAPSRGRRTLASLHGLLSIARVVSISIVRETADLGWRRGLAQRCGLVAALVTLVSFATTLPMLGALGASTLALVLLGMPLALLVVLPPAIFLVFAWRPTGRVAPTAGTACFLAVATLVLSGWLVPLSSDMLNDVLRHSLGPMMTLDSDAASHLSRSQAALAVTGWAGLAGASAICAAMVAKQSPLKSRWWLAGVPAIYVALIPLFTSTIGSSFLVFRSAGNPPEGFSPGIAAWTTTALVIAGAMTFGRRTEHTPEGHRSAG